MSKQQTITCSERRVETPGKHQSAVVAIAVRARLPRVQLKSTITVAGIRRIRDSRGLWAPLGRRCRNRLHLARQLRSLRHFVNFDPAPYLTDANVLFTFHYYDPFVFRGQGLSRLLDGRYAT